MQAVDPNTLPSWVHETAAQQDSKGGREIAKLRAKLERLEREQADADAAEVQKRDSRRDSESVVVLRPRAVRTDSRERTRNRSPAHQLARRQSRRDTLETQAAAAAPRPVAALQPTVVEEAEEAEDEEEEAAEQQLPDKAATAPAARKRGGIRFADEAEAEEAVPEPVGARVTRSKRAKIEELREEHERMVASMKEHETRKAAAAHQVSHGLQLQSLWIIATAAVG